MNRLGEPNEHQANDADRSRLRCILTLGAAAIAPVFALIPVLAINQLQIRTVSHDLLSWIACAVFLALTARGAALAARWIVVGSAPIVDRILWGVAYVAALSIAGSIAFGAAPVACAVSAYAAVLAGFWSLARLFGAASRRCGALSRLRLIDLVIALTLLGLVAGALRYLAAATGPVDFLSLAAATSGGLALGLTFGSVLLEVDAIVRQFIDARTDVETQSIAGLGIFFAILMCMTAMASPPLAVIGSFAACYLIAAAQQELSTATLFGACDSFAAGSRTHEETGDTGMQPGSPRWPAALDGDDGVKRT